MIKAGISDQKSLVAQVGAAHATGQHIATVTFTKDRKVQAVHQFYVYPGSSMVLKSGQFCAFFRKEFERHFAEGSVAEVRTMTEAEYFETRGRGH